MAHFRSPNKGPVASASTSLLVVGTRESTAILRHQIAVRVAVSQGIPVTQAFPFLHNPLSVLTEVHGIIGARVGEVVGVVLGDGDEIREEAGAAPGADKGVRSGVVAGAGPRLAIGGKVGVEVLHCRDALRVVGHHVVVFTLAQVRTRETRAAEELSPSTLVPTRRCTPTTSGNCLSPPKPIMS